MRLEVIILITGISFLKSCYIENFDNNRQHYHFKNESIAIRHEIVWDNALGSLYDLKFVCIFYLLLYNKMIIL